MARIVEKAPGWVARFLLPEIKALVKDEVQTLEKIINARFESVDARFEAVNTRFESIDKRLEALEKQFNTRFEALEKRFTLVEDVAALKAEVKTLSDKLASRA